MIRSRWYRTPCGDFYGRCKSLALLLLVVASSGCWGTSSTETSPEAEPKELTPKGKPLSTEAPEAELIKLSKRLYQVGMFSVARDSFSSLHDRYPLGAYSVFSELKLADTYFFNREYNEAAKNYEGFLKNYPGSAEAPYAKLQAARSHVASAKGAGRDRQPLERGLALFDELVKEHPGSAYGILATQERAPVLAQLVAYDREIINFYTKQDNQAAVADRERKFQQRWGDRLAELSETDAETTPKLTHPPLKELPAIQISSLVPEISTQQPLAGSELSDNQVIEPAPIEGRILVQNVRCDHAEVPFAVLELTQIPPSLSHTASNPDTITPEDEKVIIRGLNLTARQTSFNCFGSDDLTISPEGDLILTSKRAVSITALENPTRLLLTQEPE